MEKPEFIALIVAAVTARVDRKKTRMVTQFDEVTHKGSEVETQNTIKAELLDVLEHHHRDILCDMPASDIADSLVQTYMSGFKGYAHMTDAELAEEIADEFGDPTEYFACGEDEVAGILFPDD